MGFLGRAANFVGRGVGGVIGGLTGGLARGAGATNEFRAQAPVNTFWATDFSHPVPWNTFNARPANLSETNFTQAITPALAQAEGQARGPAQGTIGQMGTLADALRAQMAGQGPSLAQLQLQQATQQNAQDMASAIGSQRGINPALANRQILQAGAATNQAAVNQSAQLRMAEQLQAQQQLAALLGATGGMQLAQQGAGTQALGTMVGGQNAQNTNRISNLMQTQGINAGVAAGNQQANLANNQMYDVARMHAQDINSRIAAQNAALNMQAQGLNAGIAGANAGQQGAMLGGVLGGLGSLFGGFLGKAYGGEVDNIMGDMPDYEASAMDWYRRMLEQKVNIGGRSMGTGLSSVLASLGNRKSGGGEIIGKVPGKPRLKGDNLKNDTVPIMASPGEIVIPRSIAQAPDAPARAAAFVASIHADKKALGGEVEETTDPRILRAFAKLDLGRIG